MLRALLRLVRFPNLAIVALAQYLIYYILLLPAFQQYNLEPILDDAHFSLLVAVTVFITAGGYVINDIIDFRIDLVNRPDKVVINRQIRVQSAYWLYFCFNLMGFLLALYLSFHVECIPLANLFPLAVALLFLYSTYLKRQALVGNLLIALFCAGVAGIVWFAEREAFRELIEQAPALAGRIGSIISWYMAFAFLSTMFREVVKDMEDVQGDVGANCRTIPVRWGMKVAKGVAAAFGLGLAVFLVYLALSRPGLFTELSLAFLIFGVLAPLLLALVWVFRAREKKQFYRLSQLAKLIMLGGLAMLFFLAVL
ncbi:MAG: geranylgeranylglycerol-phosphate geranylgeranyltransferase [Lewinellaceae bacterium]|nr:geranylgeranylglycerol-phosphate geranylgeranyltransferase [Lewinellaceae bacterium]